MASKFIRRISLLALVVAAPAALATQQPSLWEDAQTGFAALLAEKHEKLDSRAATLRAHSEVLWADAGTGFAPLFEATGAAPALERAVEAWTDAGTGFEAMLLHRPYEGPAPTLAASDRV